MCWLRGTAREGLIPSPEVPSDQKRPPRTDVERVINQDILDPSNFAVYSGIIYANALLMCIVMTSVLALIYVSGASSLAQVCLLSTPTLADPR